MYEIIPLSESYVHTSKSHLQCYIFCFQMRLMEPFLLLSSWFPDHTPSIMRFISKYMNVFPAYSRVDKSYNVLAPTSYFPHHLRSEVSVEMSNCGRVVRLLHDMVLEDKLSVNLFTKVRTYTRVAGHYKFNYV